MPVSLPFVRCRPTKLKQQTPKAKPEHRDTCDEVALPGTLDIVTEIGLCDDGKDSADRLFIAASEYAAGNPT